MDKKTKKKIAYQLIFSESYSDIILNEIADIYDVDKNIVFKGSRKKNIINAKRMFIYILRNIFGLTLYEIAEITNLHHASVIHHNRKFEFFYGKYIEDTDIFKRVEAKILSVEIDEMIRVLELKNKEINKELTKLYNIKNQKYVRKERKDLLAKQYKRD
jgi:hypothetical protein|tara:strand:+ start:464 stop:940 length:477 start_codon:yes stop_codon:yes gene_type:complete